MPGSLFAVILTSKQQEGVRRLQDAYPSSKIYTELGGNIVIVADETLTSTIAEKAGLTKEHSDKGIRGAVLKLNGSFAGYTRQTFWEWIENVEDSA